MKERDIKIVTIDVGEIEYMREQEKSALARTPSIYIAK